MSKIVAVDWQRLNNLRQSPSEELNPAAFLNDSSTNLGGLMVKLALPNGTTPLATTGFPPPTTQRLINHLRERKETGQKS
ncbi:hypothetical protein NIES593_00090 [Hydrococcus rivularis NIES-593]|uniref:Uncharacterized protein n=1 Tax=Hydrococcus rivularis NIES-593 TaxID=1921803 RepID=A0A1U7HSF6_9CYAN|nr:hypothetical protein [Hydrococcus rivularis]OKH26507.1 hypothetical protein NIES593_00090 [Hydrococcus rivularis NIES-593]